jgi:hypothetical protein
MYLLRGLLTFWPSSQSPRREIGLRDRVSFSAASYCQSPKPQQQCGADDRSTRMIVSEIGPLAIISLRQS